MIVYKVEEKCMKRLITIFTAVSLILITSPATAVVYTTDFGSWEPAALIYINWGQLEPVSSGGGYGGFGSGGDNFVAPTTATLDHICRMVWGETASGEGPADFWAEITYPTPIDSVIIRHLDGSQGDSFDVHVDGVLWGHYEHQLVPPKTYSEQWFETTFSGTDGYTLRITVTDPATAWRSNWGQLGIDRIVATPEPATIMLFGFGGLALLRRKKR
jgi:hypothetical protein